MTTTKFGIKKPKMAKDKGAGLLGPMDYAKLGVDVLGPLAFELAESKQRGRLREEAKVDLDTVELMKPGVRGLRKRNLGIASRPSSGSDLETQVAENLFRDAFQQSAQNEFNFNDDMFRQQQRDRNNQIENQERTINFQTGNQEELANSNIAAQELLNINLPGRQSTFESMFQNVSGGMAQISALDSMQKISTARDIITRPDNYTPEQVAQAKRVIDGVIKGRFGGKMKTKYSK